MLKLNIIIGENLKGFDEKTKNLMKKLIISIRNRPTFEN
jgi:hypothetical protein